MIGVSHLGHVYPEATRPSIDDVSFSVNPGEMLGIIGSSGSGKSTLLQLLAGVLQPTAGELIVRAGCTVGMAMQFPEEQFFEDTVLLDVEVGPRARGLNRVDARSRATQSLKKMGLDPEQVGGMSPFSLAGDESRRAAIAGVLAIEPDCLILDEPTVGLDGRSRDLLWQNLNELAQDRELSVVVASHDLDEMAVTCDRVIIIGDGRIVAEGPPLVVFEDQEVLAAAQIAAPRCVELAELIRGSGMQATPAQVLEAIR